MSPYLQLVFLLLSTDSAPQLRGTGAGPKKMGVTSAVSDESVAGDSGVYEPSERRYEAFLSGELPFYLWVDLFLWSLCKPRTLCICTCDKYTFYILNKCIVLYLELLSFVSIF